VLGLVVAAVGVQEPLQDIGAGRPDDDHHVVGDDPGGHPIGALTAVLKSILRGRIRPATVEDQDRDGGLGDVTHDVCGLTTVLHEADARPLDREVHVGPGRAMDPEGDFRLQVVIDLSIRRGHEVGTHVPTPPLLVPLCDTPGQSRRLRVPGRPMTDE